MKLLKILLTLAVIGLAVYGMMNGVTMLMSATQNQSNPGSQTAYGGGIAIIVVTGLVILYAISKLPAL